MAQKESGCRKRVAGAFTALLLSPQAKRSKNEAARTVPYLRLPLGRETAIQTPNLVRVQVPSASVPQPATPPKHFEAPSEPGKVLPIPPNSNAQTPSIVSTANLPTSHQKSGLKEPTPGSDAEYSSDDELPEIKLALPDVPEEKKGIKSECWVPAELLGDPSQTFGSLVNKTKSEYKVEPGSNISQLLQPLVQKMESEKKHITRLEKELEVKENKISQFEETGKQLLQLRQKCSQQAVQLQEQEATISQWQTTAQQHKRSLQEEQKEVLRLREAAQHHARQIQEKDNELSQTAALCTLQQQLNLACNQQMQQLQQKDQEIIQLREAASRSAQSMQKELQEKNRKISQLEVAAKQHAAKIKEREREVTRVKESSNLSDQLKKRADQQLKTYKERLQQLESAFKENQLQLQQKDQEITKHKETAKQQTTTTQDREREVLHLREKLKKLQDSGHGDEVAQLKRLSKQQTNKIQELQKRLQDREKEVAQLRESGKKKLQEQERKMKDWLTAIPMHGVRVIDLPSYST